MAGNQAAKGTLAEVTMVVRVQVDRRRRGNRCDEHAAGAQQAHETCDQPGGILYVFDGFDRDDGVESVRIVESQRVCASKLDVAEAMKFDQ